MEKEDTSVSGPSGSRSGNRTLRFLRRVIDSLRGYFAELLRVREQDRAKIYIQVFQNSALADLNYWLEVIFSVGIATLGLIINSPAVVIGAMLISPLMGPIFGTGLAIAVGDFYLGLKALTNVILSVVSSVLLAAIITWILPFHSPTSEILSRVQPTLLDLAIAVLSGLAGAIVICRGGSGGGVEALPGVAVAVALMPPLGVVGFGVGIGWNWSIISGGGLLFLTNLVAIILSAVLVFFSIRMDAPPVRREIMDWLEKQESTDVFHAFVERSPLRRVLGNVGTLPRRVAILLIFLGVVCFPLLRTLHRLVDEARMRHIAFNDLESVIPKDSLFREDVDIGRESIHVRVMAVLPQGFSEAQRKQLEKDIQQQTGRRTDVVVYSVATRAELAELAGRSGGASAGHLETVDELQNKLWLRLKPAIGSVWPSDRAPLLDASISFSENSPKIQAHLVFLADIELGELGQESVLRNLRERSGATSIDIDFDRIPLSWKFSFLPRSTSLSPQSRLQMRELVLALKRFPNIKCAFGLSGADSGGKDLLAEKRKTLFLKALADEQISANRVQSGTEEAKANTLLVKLLAPNL